MNVPPPVIASFSVQADKKFATEGSWNNRETVKKQNIIQCWTSEYAFANLLDTWGIDYTAAGTYIGTAQNAPPDFELRVNGEKVTVGIRSRTEQDLQCWLEIPYPDDRFRTEKNRIADFTVASSVNGGIVKFYGAIPKAALIKTLERSKRNLSNKQYEYFRLIPLNAFSFVQLNTILYSANNNSKNLVRWC